MSCVLSDLGAILEFTKRQCIEIANKYLSRIHFAIGAKAIYEFVKQKGWLDECCLHMCDSEVWSKSACLDAARISATKRDFQINWKVAFQTARRKGWLDECFMVLSSYKWPKLEKDTGSRPEKAEGEIKVSITHPAPLQVLSNQWTFEDCKAAALKCKNRKEFQKNYPEEHRFSRENRWLASLFRSYDNVRPHIKRTIEGCKEVALNCETRIEFHEKYPNQYFAACRNGWLNECCAHMENDGYKIVTIEDCKKAALKCVSRSNFQKEYPIQYSSAYRRGWLDECCAHMMPQSRIKVVITFEECKEAASKCNSRSEFQKTYPKLYNAARSRGWFEQCVAHMRKLNEKYTFEQCKNAALQCANRSEFYERYYPLCRAAWRNNWMKDCCAHMVNNGETSLTFEDCKEASLQCSSKREFKEKHPSHYNTACRNGWIDNFYTPTIKPSTDYTLDQCKDAASKCNSRTEFSNKHGSFYRVAHNRGWIDECCAHMPELNKYWTLKECHEAALKCSGRREFSTKYHKQYQTARRRGWLDECCGHMVSKNKRVSATNKI